MPKRTIKIKDDSKENTVVPEELSRSVTTDTVNTSSKGTEQEYSEKRKDSNLKKQEKTTSKECTDSSKTDLDNPETLVQQDENTTQPGTITEEQIKKEVAEEIERSLSEIRTNVDKVSTKHINDLCEGTITDSEHLKFLLDYMTHYYPELTLEHPCEYTLYYEPEKTLVKTKKINDNSNSNMTSDKDKINSLNKAVENYSQNQKNDSTEVKAGKASDIREEEEATKPRTQLSTYSVQPDNDPMKSFNGIKWETEENQNIFPGTNTYEYVEHPQHYNNYDVEVIEMMRRIWGDKDVATWAKLNAFKYRMRMGTKPNEPTEQDLKKEKFYLDTYNKLSR